MNSFKFTFVLIGFASFAAACGSRHDDVAPPGGGAGSSVGPAVSALISSVPDDCQLETYVGPFRGYELPYVINGTWSDRYSYTSGLGDEIVSGFEAHRSAGQGVPKPVCADLERVLLAAPVTDAASEQRTYALVFRIDASSTGFPLSREQARTIGDLPANLSASFTISVLRPCAQPGTSECWEHLADQTFPADFTCSTSKTIERTIPAEKLTDTDNEFDYRRAYHLEFPDGCAFRVVNAEFKLADGRSIRASIAGTASTELAGPRLRILRISPRR